MAGEVVREGFELPARRPLPNHPNALTVTSEGFGVFLEVAARGVPVLLGNLLISTMVSAALQAREWPGVLLQG